MATIEKDFKFIQAYDFPIVKDIYDQISSKKLVLPTPKPLNINHYPIIRHSFTNEFTPKHFKEETVNDDFGIQPMNVKIAEPKSDIDLEGDVLKPIYGVKDLKLIDKQNPAYYQFKLKGKNDVDLAIDNLDEEDTALDQLVENATTGEPLSDIKTNSKIRNAFDKVVKSRVGYNLTEKDGETTLKQVDNKFKAQRTIRKGIQLKPVVAEKAVADIESSVIDNKIDLHKQLTRGTVPLTRRKPVVKPVADIESGVIDNKIDLHKQLTGGKVPLRGRKPVEKPIEKPVEKLPENIKITEDDDELLSKEADEIVSKLSFSKIDASDKSSFKKLFESGDITKDDIANYIKVYGIDSLMYERLSIPQMKEMLIHSGLPDETVLKSRSKNDTKKLLERTVQGGGYVAPTVKGDGFVASQVRNIESKKDKKIPSAFDKPKIFTTPKKV